MSKKYKTFKPGDKVIVKTMNEIKQDFKLYFGEGDGEYYLGPLEDIYFGPEHQKLCGKQVTIQFWGAENMTEDYYDYKYWQNLYYIKERVYVDSYKGLCSTTWSVTMFKEEHGV